MLISRLRNSKKVQRCQYPGASLPLRFNERRNLEIQRKSQREYASSMTRKKCIVYRSRDASGRSRSTCWRQRIVIVIASSPLSLLSQFLLRRHNPLLSRRKIHQILNHFHGLRIAQSYGVGNRHGNRLASQYYRPR